MTLVDAHVHIHDCFPLGEFFDRAHANFRRHARSPFTAVLALTETSSEDAFAALRKAPRAANGWRIEETDEPGSLRALGASGSLLLLAGRQVAAREDLEVLLLGETEKPPDGLPIRRVLEIGKERGAVRVIPWGAGKWLFARGKLLREILRAEDARSFCLGDEGGRPFFWPTPRPFQEARRLGIRVLPGTDPLPFAREVGRAGSYGFKMMAALDPARPARSLQALLADPALAIEPYGAREGLAGFVRNQFAMQARKRRRRVA